MPRYYLADAKVLVVTCKISRLLKPYHAASVLDDRAHPDLRTYLP